MYLQLYLKNTTQDELNPLTIPGCDFACSINQFINLLGSIVITGKDWKIECEFKTPNYVPRSEFLP